MPFANLADSSSLFVLAITEVGRHSKTRPLIRSGRGGDPNVLHSHTDVSRWWKPSMRTGTLGRSPSRQGCDPLQSGTRCNPGRRSTASSAFPLPPRCRTPVRQY